MRNQPTLRAPLIGIALQRAAAPALGFVAFLTGLVAIERERVHHVRELRAARSRVVATLVHNRRARRSRTGRFLPVKPLETELAAVNEQLHAVG